MKSDNRSRLGCGGFCGCPGGAATAGAIVGGFDGDVNEWSTEFGLLVGADTADFVNADGVSGVACAGEPGGVKLVAGSAAVVG